MPRIAGAVLASLLVVGAAGSALAAAKTPRLTGIWLLDQHTYDRQEEFQPPLKAEVRTMAEEKRRMRDQGGQSLSDNNKKCLPIGMPGMVTNEFAMEILETPGRITIASENSPLIRTLSLTRKTHRQDVEPSWNGDSIAHWEGATLAVETTRLNDRMSHFPFGFGGALTLTTKITERYRLAKGGKDLINVMTFDDPNVITGPWTVSYTYHRAPAAAELWEYVCEVESAGWSERFAGDPQFQKDGAPKP